MPFDIPLQKPAGREHKSNRTWLTLVLSALPQFREEERDHLAWARDLASDVGLTADEYVRRGLGLAAECETEDFWMRVSFWEQSATLELPNFPQIGTGAALGRASTVISVLEGAGFTLCDPETAEPIAGDARAALEAAYVARQATVARVAALTGGRPT
jgi:hypothetical protein